jgi:uroporphyrinogen decarboxylase
LLIDLLESLPRVPILYFGKGTRDHIHTLRELPATGLSCDETISLPEARSYCPSLVIQGNFPPELLLGDPSSIRKELRRMLEPMREDPAYIVNLSHGVLPQTPEENLHLFVETVHELRAH